MLMVLTFFLPLTGMQTGSKTARPKRKTILPGGTKIPAAHPGVQGIIHSANSLETKMRLNSMNAARKAFWIQIWMDFVQERWWLQMQCLSLDIGNAWSSLEARNWFPAPRPAEVPTKAISLLAGARHQLGRSLCKRVWEPLRPTASEQGAVNSY